MAEGKRKYKATVQFRSGASRSIEYIICSDDPEMGLRCYSIGADCTIEIVMADVQTIDTTPAPDYEAVDETP